MLGMRDRETSRKQAYRARTEDRNDTSRSMMALTLELQGRFGHSAWLNRSRIMNRIASHRRLRLSLPPWAPRPKYLASSSPSRAVPLVFRFIPCLLHPSRLAARCRCEYISRHAVLILLPLHLLHLLLLLHRNHHYDRRISIEQPDAIALLIRLTESLRHNAPGLIHLSGTGICPSVSIYLSLAEERKIQPIRSRAL